MKVLLVVYDNESYVHMFPIGTAYIAAALREAGHDVAVYNQDMRHDPPEYLTEYLNQHDFDVVGVGVIAGYYQYRKLLEISEAINESDNRPKYYILGGHGPTPEPEYFLQKTGADIVVMGEGEETVVDLLETLPKDESFLFNVRGIAFRHSKGILGGCLLIRLILSNGPHMIYFLLNTTGCRDWLIAPTQTLSCLSYRPEDAPSTVPSATGWILDTELE